jgi:hypothetical protein
VGQPFDLTKIMAKPAPFAARTDQEVDTAILSFETYFSAIGVQVEDWPMLATNFLKDAALTTWMNVMVPLRKQNLQPTWAHFTKCLRDAYGVLNKEHDARKQFLALNQRHFSAKEYVRHARGLLAQILHDPPSESDKLMHLYKGLRASFKESAPLHPTGRPWHTFDELADHILMLEHNLPQKFSTSADSKFSSRGTPRVFASTAKPAPRPKPPVQGRPTLPGGRGGGRGSYATATRDNTTHAARGERSRSPPVHRVSRREMELEQELNKLKNAK